MTSSIHPARAIPYDDLIAGLNQAREAGAVHRRYDSATGLSLFVYSNACVHDDLWNEFSILARGLILDESERKVAATPFSKFFNAGERHGGIPDGPFEAFEKLDGSLVIVFMWHGRWLCTTKGAFGSDQAKWAKAWIETRDMSAFDACTTYLFEATYPENRIVVKYDQPALVLLAAYDGIGREVTYDDLERVSRQSGFPLAKRYAFGSIADIITHVATLPKTEEGFVVRFSNGTRLKLKGAEYRRIHALISNCTPLAIWEAMGAGDDMAAIRRDLPEEFWPDFDAIVALLVIQLRELETKIDALATATAHMSDKDIGLALKTFDREISPYLFGYRKFGFAGRVRHAAHRSIRPTGNALNGYVPSYAMIRVQEET